MLDLWPPTGGFLFLCSTSVSHGEFLKPLKAASKSSVLMATLRYIKITASEYEALENAQRIKRGLIQAGGNGVAIAGGMAAGEALLAGGAYAAEAAVVAAEASVVVPIVLTATAIVGVGALCWWGVQCSLLRHDCAFCLLHTSSQIVQTFTCKC